MSINKILITNVGTFYISILEVESYLQVSLLIVSLLLSFIKVVKYVKKGDNLIYNSHNQLSVNFNSKEFDSSDIIYSGNYIDSDLIAKLQYARDLLGFGIEIVSGVRSIEHNSKVGGVKDSSHLIFLACDIKVNSSQHRYELLKVLISVGFTRLGIGNSFIHVDIDTSKRSKLMWLY